MKMTSAQASKLLRQLNDELRTLQVREENSKSFLASLGEEVESVRPSYDYASMQEEQIKVEQKIRKLKHAVNVFNTNTVIPEYGFTIDEMLVYLPQLQKRQNKLFAMKDALPKVRENVGFGRGTNVVDYRYANYDIDLVGKDYKDLSAEIARAQLALDTVNSTVELEVDL